MHEFREELMRFFFVTFLATFCINSSADATKMFEDRCSTDLSETLHLSWPWSEHAHAIWI